MDASDISWYFDERERETFGYVLYRQIVLWANASDQGSHDTVVYFSTDCKPQTPSNLLSSSCVCKDFHLPHQTFASPTSSSNIINKRIMLDTNLS